MSDVPTVVLLIGDEALLVQEAEAEHVKQAFGGASPGFNLAVYRAGEGAGDAVSLARTQPMMARRRVVVIRELERANVALLDELIVYCASPNPSTTLILACAKLPPKAGGMDRGTRLSNQIKKAGLVRRFMSKDQRPEAHAIAYAESLGCRLGRDAASLLVELSGSDLGRLRLEVAKAAAYVSGPRGPGGAGKIDLITIDRPAVEAVCSVVAEAEVWDLSNAVVNRDPDRALAAVYRMLEVGNDGSPHRLLAVITWQLRELVELQSALRAGAALPGSWSRMPGARVQRARELLQRRPLHPAVLFGALERANQSFNRSPAGGQRIFEALVLELTAG